MLETGLFTIDKTDVVVDTGELKRRLSLPKDYDVSLFDESIIKMREQIAPKCCFVRTEIEACEGNVDFGFTRVESRDLSRNLRGCKEAFIFAVTLGHTAERFLSKLSLLSPSDFFICDAVSSSLAESVCDIAEGKIKDGLDCKPDSFLMLPQKSITAIIGIKQGD